MNSMKSQHRAAGIGAVAVVQDGRETAQQVEDVKIALPITMEEAAVLIQGS